MWERNLLSIKEKIRNSTYEFEEYVTAKSIEAVIQAYALSVCLYNMEVEQ